MNLQNIMQAEARNQMYILYISSFKSSMKGKLIYSDRDQVIGCLGLWEVLPVRGHKVGWRQYLTFWLLWWIHRCENVPKLIKLVLTGLPLVVQWLRICLTMQGTQDWIPSLGRFLMPPAAKPMCHNYWNLYSRARAQQREKPPPDKFVIYQVNICLCSFPVLFSGNQMGTFRIHVNVEH